MLITENSVDRAISIAFISNQENIFQIANNLSSEDIKIKSDIIYQPQNVGKQIEQAIKRNFDFIVFFLDNEKGKNILKIKNLKSREEIECKNDITELVNILKIQSTIPKPNS